MVDDAASGAGFKVADRIQNTLIGQAITAAQVEEHVADAQRIGFNAVTVPGCWVGFARELLRRNGPAHVALGAILDFPYGSATTAERVAGAAALVAAGATEIDATVNIGLALSSRRAEFSADLVEVVTAARPVPVKFMLELPLLTAQQRDFVVDAAVAAGAAFVKNASRGAVGIADAAQISYLRHRVPDSVGVKASGGIRTLRQVCELLEAGADLIGTSAGVAIVTGTRTAGDTLDAY